MRLLFAYGTKLKKDDTGCYYTGGGFNDNVWNRYLSITQEVTLVARVESETYSQRSAISRFNRFPDDSIDIVETRDAWSSLGSFFNSRLRAANRKQIEEAVRSADFVIARLPDSVGTSAITFCRKHKKPYIVELVGCPWDSLWNYGSLAAKVLAPLVYLRTRIEVKRARWVIYVSKRFLQARYPTKGRQLACPDVILEEPSSEVLERRLRKIEKMNEEGPVVLGLIGSLDVAYRGHETAIRTLASLGDDRYRLRFLGGGAKEHWDTLAAENDIAERVEYSGQLPSGRAVLEWIDDIDILIMPTRQETLGRAIVEAMSRGCPVIGSVETAIPEQIGSDCVCPANDHEGFAEIVRRMIRNPRYMKAVSYTHLRRRRCLPGWSLTR